MLYKRVTVWFIEGQSVIAVDYSRVNVTVSGDYLILSSHNDIYLSIVAITNSILKFNYMYNLYNQIY